MKIYTAGDANGSSIIDEIKALKNSKKFLGYIDRDFLSNETKVAQLKTAQKIIPEENVILLTDESLRQELSLLEIFAGPMRNQPIFVNENGFWIEKLMQRVQSLSNERRNVSDRSQIVIVYHETQQELAGKIHTWFEEAFPEVGTWIDFKVCNIFDDRWTVSHKTLQVAENCQIIISIDAEKEFLDKINGLQKPVVKVSCQPQISSNFCYIDPEQDINSVTLKPLLEKMGYYLMNDSCPIWQHMSNLQIVEF